MGSKQEVADFIFDQLEDCGEISLKKMFGEFALYCEGKVVASVCDNQLFVKPTPAGEKFIGQVELGEPYPGAKPCFIISGDRWEDREWLSELIRITAAALPEPKKKKKK